MRGLTDRHAERGVLDGLVEAVCAAESRVLVVHGEPGVGKSVLLEYLADRSAGCRVLRVSEVQSEMGFGLPGALEGRIEDSFRQCWPAGRFRHARRAGRWRCGNVRPEGTVMGSE